MKASSDRMNGLIERALVAEVTPEELERLEAWRRASPENERHYAQVARLLATARALGPVDASLRVPAAAELLAARRRSPGPQRAEPQLHRPRRSPAWLPWGIAAAAVLALVYTWSGRVAGPANPTVIRTGPTELATVQLEDGSVVRLGPASRLRVMRSSRAREVALDGRAFFDVVEAPGRPFRVRTALGNAEVLGTRFEINARRDDLELVVVDGRVALSAGDREVEVSTGEIGGIVRGTLVPPRRLADADPRLRWAGIFLVFRSTSLRDAVAEVERAYDIAVTITDPTIAGHTVTATFVDQSAAEVLGVLCTIVDARCDVRPGAATISR